MVDLLEPILKSSRARQLYEQLGASLEDEARRRQAWRDAKDEKEKSEWINGEVFVHSPVKLEHGRTSQRVLKIVDAIVETRQLGAVGFEKFLVGMIRNDFEPDLCFWRSEVASTFQLKP